MATKTKRREGVTEKHGGDAGKPEPRVLTERLSREPGRKSKTLRRFRLKKGVGPHFEKNPDFDPNEEESPDNLREVEYKPGSVVKSTKDLVAAFPNKFDEFDTMGRMIEPETIDPDEENEKVKEENLKLKALAEEEGAEDPFEAEYVANSGTDRDPAERRRLKAKMDEDDDEEEDDTPRSKKQKDKGYGEDVTDDFERASDAGLSVRKRGTSYFVMDPDNEDRPLSSKKGIKRIEVNKFIRRHVKRSNSED